MLDEQPGLRSEGWCERVAATQKLWRREDFRPRPPTSLGLLLGVGATQAKRVVGSPPPGLRRCMGGEWSPWRDREGDRAPSTIPLEPVRKDARVRRQCIHGLIKSQRARTQETLNLLRAFWRCRCACADTASSSVVGSPSANRPERWKRRGGVRGRLQA
jgi:hypothetical protein